MATVDCFDCERTFDRSEVTWIRWAPEKGMPGPDESREIPYVMADEEDESALPMCPQCLKNFADQNPQSS